MEHDQRSQLLINLLQFYSECIEEEDRRSLTRKLSQHRYSFVAPWDQETFFTTDLLRLTFKPAQEADSNTLGRWVDTDKAKTLFYGYPTFLDSSDMVFPLFFKEVELTRMASGEFSVTSTDAGEICFNHHVLNRLRYPIDELVDVQRHLESDKFGSIEARLAETFELLGVPFELFDTPGFSSRQLRRDVWYDRAILFQSEHSVYTYHLRRELAELRKSFRFTEHASATSLGRVVFPEMKAPEHDETKEPFVLAEIRPLNMSQESALRSGLKNDLTVVTGPPGTGKSQVVVNLIANAVLHNQTILFASKNNKAVDVVRAWMTEILGENEDWVFRAGNKQRMAELQKNIVDRLMVLQDFLPQSMDGLDLQLRECEQKLKKISDQIQDKRNCLSKLESLGAKRASLIGTFPHDWTDVSLDCRVQYDVLDFKKWQQEVSSLAQGKGLGLKLRFLRLIHGPRLAHRYASFLRDMLKSSFASETIQDDFNDMILRNGGYSELLDFSKRIQSFSDWCTLNREFAAAEEHLQQMPSTSNLMIQYEQGKDEKVDLSRALLRLRWTNRIRQNRVEVISHVKSYFDAEGALSQANKSNWQQRKREYERAARRLFSFFPIWIVTNLSVRRSLPLVPNLFDMCVIDEASQCDIPSAFPLLYRAKRAIIIGDPKQLRHISTLPARKEEDLAQKCALDDVQYWSYTSKSIYDISERALFANKTEPILLREHYRSHPEIIEFSNRIFYGSLIGRTDMDEVEKRLGKLPPGFFWHDVCGTISHELSSAENRLEAALILDMIENWMKQGLLDDSAFTIGVVTPFRRQADHVRTELGARHWPPGVKGRITIGTVHTFQGDEADVVFFSTVVAADMPPRKKQWVAENSELLNVAVTRARGALHVVGDMAECKAAGGVLTKLAEYAEKLAIQKEAFVGLFESEPERIFAQILDELGLWYQPQHEQKHARYDFLVASPLGTLYDMEIDGRHHSSDFNLKNDLLRDLKTEEAGHRVIRFSARSIMEESHRVKEFLTHLP